MIAQHHLDMLAASGISAEHAHPRGYETITDTNRLADVKVVPTRPPYTRPDGAAASRRWLHLGLPIPARPSAAADRKLVKYERRGCSATGSTSRPESADRSSDPAITLWIVEGVTKGDCGALHGLCVVALSGVWNWMCTTSAGGKMALPELRDVALNGRRVIIAFDGDIARKESVQKAYAHASPNYLATRGARIEYLHLPDTDDKTGLDDYLAGHTVEDLRRLVEPHQPRPRDEPTRGSASRGGNPAPVRVALRRAGRVPAVAAHR